MAELTKGPFVLECLDWFMAWPDEAIRKFRKFPELRLIMLHYGLAIAIWNEFPRDKSRDELRQVEEELCAAGWIRRIKGPGWNVFKHSHPAPQNDLFLAQLPPR